MLGDVAAEEGTRAASLGSFPFAKTVNFVCLFVLKLSKAWFGHFLCSLPDPMLQPASLQDNYHSKS